MSHEIQIALPDPAVIQLKQLAAAAGEPLSRLAARFVRHRLDHAANDCRSDGPEKAP